LGVSINLLDAKFDYWKFYCNFAKLNANAYPYKLMFELCVHIPVTVAQIVFK